MVAPKLMLSDWVREPTAVAISEAIADQFAGLVPMKLTALATAITDVELAALTRPFARVWQALHSLAKSANALECAKPHTSRMTSHNRRQELLGIKPSLGCFAVVVFWAAPSGGAPPENSGKC